MMKVNVQCITENHLGEVKLKLLIVSFNGDSTVKRKAYYLVRSLRAVSILT